jgi:hypothetical protein
MNTGFDTYMIFYELYVMWLLNNPRFSSPHSWRWDPVLGQHPSHTLRIYTITDRSPQVERKAISQCFVRRSSV